MTLIKDLIDIPDHVAGGDFVLALTDGVSRADSTVSSYVVTEQLAECFDKALKLIRDALNSVQTSGGTTTSTSKAVYLNGSFGSGKSHFMAVLDLLLAGNTAARSLPELGTVVADHDAWLKDRKFLLVPYHLIGADDLESAIFGGYVRWIEQEHPGADIPPVYASASVLRNATELRGSMGDEAFFAKLNEGTEGGPSKWGKMASPWDAERYDKAVSAGPDDAEHLALVSVVVDKLLPAFKDLHRGFVTIDQGLSIISRHAQSLGYDGLVLFLDELILWLASRIKADLDWANEEGSKLAKLVESGDSARPIPIVSFIARQRDLRDLVGGATGADELRFFDALQWWEGRFTPITLEDRNLPLIANRRMLQPKDESARKQLEAAVDQAFTKYATAADLLLGDDTERREHAKLVYPFSPALVTTLVDVSSVLQRERTALKVMQALLVNQRETLRVGELIPVGELYDVIAQEDQPFSDALRLQFDHARTLYRTRIRPQLMAMHGLDSETEIEGLPTDHAFVGQDRLVKTVMLAALVPETPALRDLTASKLEQLNAGSIETFIPGGERAEVIDLFRQLVSRGIGEFELTGDPENPRISLRLHGVDVESIISNAKIEDSPGSRRAKVRDLLAGAVDEADLFSAKRHKLTWRGSPRDVDIVFGNIRSSTDLPDDRLLAEERPKVVIDFPFDPDGHPPTDDLARVEEFTSAHEDTLTICWLPSHLNPPTLDQLGRLVVLEYLDTGDNFDRHASHLPKDDRDTARRLIGSQARTLREEMKHAFEEAYGVRPIAGGSRFIDDPLAPADQFKSLHHAKQASIPAAANIGAALDDLSGQLLALQYPAHPEFGSLIRPADVAKVWEQIQRAAQQPLGRLEFVAGERSARDLMLKVATPLGLGTTGENHFVLGDEWKNRMVAAVSEAKNEDAGFVPTVRWARRQLDEPTRRGLSAELGNLVIATFALQADYSFQRAGQNVPVDIRNLDDDLVLVRQALPEEQHWKDAVELAQHVFGWTGGDYRSADNLLTLAERVQAEANAHRDGARRLVDALDLRSTTAGVAQDCSRRRNAEAGASLVGQLAGAATPADVVSVLANMTPPTSAAALGKSLKTAADVAAAIDDANWPLIASALADGSQGAALKDELRAAFEADELALDLAVDLDRIEAVATQLKTQPAAAPDSSSDQTSAADVLSSGEEILTADGLDDFVGRLGSKLEAGQQVRVRWEITDS